MAEMATKARAFQDFLDAKEIKAFVSETIENDPEQNRKIMWFILFSSRKIW